MQCKTGPTQRFEIDAKQDVVHVMNDDKRCEIHIDSHGIAQRNKGCRTRNAVQDETQRANQRIQEHDLNFPNRNMPYTIVKMCIDELSRHGKRSAFTTYTVHISKIYTSCCASLIMIAVMLIGCCDVFEKTVFRLCYLHSHFRPDYVARRPCLFMKTLRAGPPPLSDGALTSCSCKKRRRTSSALWCS